VVEAHVKDRETRSEPQSSPNKGTLSSTGSGRVTVLENEQTKTRCDGVEPGTTARQTKATAVTGMEQTKSLVTELNQSSDEV
jgi:hypothetical protein